MTHTYHSILRGGGEKTVQIPTNKPCCLLQAQEETSWSWPGPDVGGWGGGPSPLAMKRAANDRLKRSNEEHKIGRIFHLFCRWIPGRKCRSHRWTVRARRDCVPSGAHSPRCPASCLAGQAPKAGSPGEHRKTASRKAPACSMILPPGCSTHCRRPIGVHKLVFRLDVVQSHPRLAHHVSCRNKTRGMTPSQLQSLGRM